MRDLVDATKVTAEAVKEYREAHPHLGLMEAKRNVQRQALKDEITNIRDGRWHTEIKVRKLCDILLHGLDERPFT